MFKCSQDNSAGYIFFCIMIRICPNSSKFPLSPTAQTPSPSNCNPPPRTTSNDRGKCSAFPFRNLAFIRCVHAACEECYTSSLSIETHYWKLNISKNMPKNMNSSSTCRSVSPKSRPKTSSPKAPCLRRLNGGRSMAFARVPSERPVGVRGNTTPPLS